VDHDRTEHRWLVVLALAGCGGPDGTCPPTGCETVPDGSASPDAIVVDAPPSVDAMFVPSDPFTVDETCPAAWYSELVARFPPGATAVAAGTFTLTSRTRTCVAATGCGPWNEPAPVELNQITVDNAGQAVGTPHALPSAGDASLTLGADPEPPMALELANPEPQSPATTIRFRCGAIEAGGIADYLGCLGWVEAPGVEAELLRHYIDTYAGEALYDSTTVVQWHGRICRDGRYQLVTHLGPELSSVPITAANNRNQLAIYGQL
jgi:hypothetical protein